MKLQVKDKDYSQCTFNGNAPKLGRAQTRKRSVDVPLEISFSCTRAEKVAIESLRSYPKNDPTGVLTADTMYTGGNEDMIAM
jgi:hypothetical protein